MGLIGKGVEEGSSQIYFPLLFGSIFTPVRRNEIQQLTFSDPESVNADTYNALREGGWKLRRCVECDHDIGLDGHCS